MVTYDTDSETRLVTSVLIDNSWGVLSFPKVRRQHVGVSIIHRQLGLDHRLCGLDRLGHPSLRLADYSQDGQLQLIRWVEFRGVKLATRLT